MYHGKTMGGNKKHKKYVKHVRKFYERRGKLEKTFGEVIMFPK